MCLLRVCRVFMNCCSLCKVYNSVYRCALSEESLAKGDKTKVYCPWCDAGWVTKQSMWPPVQVFSGPKPESERKAHRLNECERGTFRKSEEQGNKYRETDENGTIAEVCCVGMELFDSVSSVCETKPKDLESVIREREERSQEESHRVYR